MYSVCKITFILKKVKFLGKKTSCIDVSHHSFSDDKNFLKFSLLFKADFAVVVTSISSG